MSGSKKISEPINEPSDQEIAPLMVKRGRVASVTLYEIKDSELDILENGSPSSIQLNFAIFAISLAFSAICTLTSATFSNSRVENVVTFVAVIGCLFGFYLLFMWNRTRTSLKDVCSKIRERVPPDVLPQLPVTPDNEPGNGPGPL